MGCKCSKMGYQWKVGDGKKIKFWEDQWFGDSSLAIQYWELYMITNEQTITIAEAWDSTQLKITCRRCFNYEMLHKWYEILEVANTLHLNEEEDTILWNLQPNGIYTVRSLYVVVNFRCVRPEYVHAIWKIKVPPKIHFSFGY
uniref:Uncharacterized protein n=1 Tax=Avena sativa TaxID=4498 RepID=A0ACD5WXN0_AVESA